MGVGVSTTPGRFTPEKDPVPIVQAARWAHRAGLGGWGKSRPPPGFDPRTVQPVASRYTDWAIAARIFNYTDQKPTKDTVHRQIPIIALNLLHVSSQLCHYPGVCSSRMISVRTLDSARTGEPVAYFQFKQFVIRLNIQVPLASK